MSSSTEPEVSLEDMKFVEEAQAVIKTEDTEDDLVGARPADDVKPSYTSYEEFAEQYKHLLTRMDDDDGDYFY